MREFLEDTWPMWVLVIFFIAALVWAVNKNGEQVDAFMAECTKHRHNYECVAMWRAGDANITPVPIITPVR